MDSLQAPEPSEADAFFEVTVTEDAIRFTTGELPACIYLDPKLNHTPAQCAQLMKLRRNGGNEAAFRDSSSRLRAVIRFAEDDTALVTVLEADGSERWTDTLQAAECLPDSPAFLVPRIRPMYRALTAAFMLFLLFLLAIVPLYMRRPTYATEASIAILLVVVACVGVLILIRTWLKL